MHGTDILSRDERPYDERVPFLEFTDGGPKSGIHLLQSAASPRIIKTHMGHGFFIKPIKQQVKIVVVLRNIKDVLVSYYHFYKFCDEYSFKGSFDEYFELFRDKHLSFGDWFDWVLGWWQECNNPNVLFVTYEDMKEDILREARRVCQFLGKDRTDDQLKEIIDYSSFGKMKKRILATNKAEKEGVGQLRKGAVGNWTDYLNQEQSQYVDQLLREKITGTGLVFKENL